MSAEADLGARVAETHLSTPRARPSQKARLPRAHEKQGWQKSSCTTPQKRTSQPHARLIARASITRGPAGWYGAPNSRGVPRGAAPREPVIRRLPPPQWKRDQPLRPERETRSGRCGETQSDPPARPRNSAPASPGDRIRMGHRDSSAPASSYGGVRRDNGGASENHPASYNEMKNNFAPPFVAPVSRARPTSSTAPDKNAQSCRGF